MKTKIVIILALIILIILSALAVKRYMDNSVVDKHGMIREEETVTVINGYIFTE